MPSINLGQISSISKGYIQPTNTQLLWLNYSDNLFYFYSGGSWISLYNSGMTVDEMIKVSSVDLVAGYLNAKLTGGDGISISTVGAGGTNQSLLITNQVTELVSLTDVDFNYPIITGQTLVYNGTLWVNSAVTAAVADTAPNSPQNLILTEYPTYVEIKFTGSTTSNIDTYEVYSSFLGTSSFNLIGKVDKSSIEDEMIIQDTTFSNVGDYYYRVYAIKSGLYSDFRSGTTNVTITIDSTESFIGLNDVDISSYIDGYIPFEHGSGLTHSSNLVYSGNTLTSDNIHSTADMVVDNNLTVLADTVTGSLSTPIGIITGLTAFNLSLNNYTVTGITNNSGLTSNSPYLLPTEWAVKRYVDVFSSGGTSITVTLAELSGVSLSTYLSYTGQTNTTINNITNNFNNFTGNTYKAFTGSTLNLFLHTGRTDNPHQTTIEQLSGVSLTTFLQHTASTSGNTFLLLTDTPSSYNNERILFESASAVIDSANFKFDSTNVNLKVGGDILATQPTYSISVGSGNTVSNSYSSALGQNLSIISSHSHGEGIGVKVGAYGYLADSVVSGVITLNNTYADLTGQFAYLDELYLNDYDYGAVYGIITVTVSSVTFDLTSTIITLTDLSINTSTGSLVLNLTQTNTWNGDMLIGYATHAEGGTTIALGDKSHAEGYNTRSIREYTHTEGYSTTALGEASHSEGYNSTSLGNHSHSEGLSTIAYGDASHAEGAITVAIGTDSHAEGASTTAYVYAHAEGYLTKAIGTSSHSEGSETIASGYTSHSGGYHTTARGFGQTVIGSYNILNGNKSITLPENVNMDDYVFIVGSGSGETYRNNALSVSWKGNLFVTSGITLGSGIYANEISDDSGLTDASHSALITEYAAKGYIDNINIQSSSGVSLATFLTYTGQTNTTINNITNNFNNFTGNTYKAFTGSTSVLFLHTGNTANPHQTSFLQLTDTDMMTFTINRVPYETATSLTDKATFRFDASRNDLYSTNIIITGLTATILNLNGYVSITGVTNNSGLTGNSRYALPTEFAVKNYIVPNIVNFNNFTGNTYKAFTGSTLNLFIHTGRTDNPHNVTIAQISGVSIDDFNAYTSLSGTTKAGTFEGQMLYWNYDFADPPQGYWEITSGSTTNSLIWDDTSKQLEVSNVLIPSNGKLYFRDTSNFIQSSGSNALTINGNVNTYFNYGTTNKVMHIDYTGVNVNEVQSSSNDFRVSSLNNVNMFVVDSSEDKIGINTNSPSHTLTVNGDVMINNTLNLDVIYKNSNIVSPYIIDLNTITGMTSSVELLYVGTYTGQTVNVYLPSGSTIGRILTIGGLSDTVIIPAKFNLMSSGVEKLHNIDKSSILLDYYDTIILRYSIVGESDEFGWKIISYVDYSTLNIS